MRHARGKEPRILGGIGRIFDFIILPADNHHYDHSKTVRGAHLSIVHDRRNWTRLDKVFPVLVESPVYGFVSCVARNISPGGVFLETRDPLPLGTPLRIYFALPHGTGGIAASGEVKNHYYLNYHQDGAPRSLMGMGVRFLHFEEDTGESLRRTLGGFRTLH